MFLQNQIRLAKLTKEEEAKEQEINEQFASGELSLEERLEKVVAVRMDSYAKKQETAELFRRIHNNG